MIMHLDFKRFNNLRELFNTEEVFKIPAGMIGLRGLPRLSHPGFRMGSEDQAADPLPVGSQPAQGPTYLAKMTGDCPTCHLKSYTGSPLT